MEFAGRVAVVTGTTGIGRAVAARLAGAGAKVFALGINDAANAELEKVSGVTVIKCDVSSSSAVSKVFSEIEEGGRLDIIVNAAAIHPYGDAVETSPEMFAKCLAVNAGSIHLTAHFGVPLMRKAGNGGVIVNLSSVQGHACQAGVMAYVASKGAIHAMTRAMALDFAKDKIRVVSVSPGSVRTPILELAARTFDGPEADIDGVFRRFGEAHPIGRIGEPEEIAEFIAFLCSDRAGFITGSDHVIDGALTAALGVG
jgi:meso-butanediol dehydrogenase / (S,S)-butanediol dehydrogenase / diacetyl reductase